MKQNKLALPEYIRNNFDKYKYVLLICCVGLLLTLWPSKPKEREAAAPAPAEGGFSAYMADTAALEQELAGLLSQMEGVGRVRVLLSAKRGYEPAYIYNSSSKDTGGENQPSKEQQSELVIVSRSGEENPVIASVNGPEYRGAVVICDGAGSAQVRLEVTEAIKSLTGITSDNIKISKMKQ